MSPLVKALLGSALLLSGVAATLVMLGLMGGQKEGKSSSLSRSIHRALGALYALLLVALVSIGVRYVAWAGEPSPRIVFHIVFAAGIFAGLALKILIARFFRGSLRIAPSLGLLLFVLTIIVFSISAGFYFARSAIGPERGRDTGLGEPEPGDGAIAALDAASIEAGRAIYEQECAFCHHADRADSKLGPGLEGLLRAETLPSSGRPATIENVILQLREPIGTMPAYTSFTERELAALSAYLASL